jgi:hypothetical protein
MSASEAASSVPSSDAAVSAATRRAADLAFLRAQSSPEVITRAALEALAAGIYCSPASGVFFFLDGVLAAKYPRVARGLPMPPVPQTFPGVVASAARHAWSCSARSIAWLILANSAAAAGREAARLGPRFNAVGLIEDGGAGGGAAAAAPPPSPSLQPRDWRVAGVGFVSGSVCSIIVTTDWAREMGRARRGVYVAMGGLAGVALPHFFAVLGPSVRRFLARASPAKRE